MFHGLNNTYLYSAFKIVPQFEDPYGKTKEVIGTAFFLQVGGEIHLVTNRHNIDLSYKEAKYKDFRLKVINVIGRFSGDNLTTCYILPEVNVIGYSERTANDIACVLSPTILSEAGSSTVLDYFVTEEMIATASDFANRLMVCDFVAFPGYPEWHDQINHRPILRTGTIASDPRFDYRCHNDMGEAIAYEAFSYGGSSGSPVFAVQKGLKPGAGISFAGFRPAMFIGINAGHLQDPSNGHSGISYFFKAPAIVQTILDTKAKA